MSQSIEFRDGYSPSWIDSILEIHNKTVMKRDPKLRETVNQAFESSFAVCTAWFDSRLIGSARMLSDGKMYSGIFDVVVDPEFQRQGVGRELMNRLITKASHTCIYLTSTFGNEQFYSKLGFKKHKTAMALYPAPMANSPYLLSETNRQENLVQLTPEIPEESANASSWYAKASRHDFLGEEHEAEICYRRCFELGFRHLPASEQPRFFVGFGSTLRNNLKYVESITVLTEAVEHFHDYPALKAFLALTYYSNRQDRLAAETLFSCILNTNCFDGFERAIQSYVENLKTHPESRDRDDNISICDYNPEWPKYFLKIAEKLKRELAGLYISIDHIGSTSVPGLAAKPRIDIQITVQELDDLEKSKLDAALESGGFSRSQWRQDHQPETDNSSKNNWDKLFLSGKVEEPEVFFNIHVRAKGAANQIYSLLFRDYLREHRDAALIYERAKRELARHHPQDAVAYTELKDPICDLIMAAAKRWASETNRH